jgi:hypothetical protein
MTVMKTKGSVFIHLVAGLACLGVHAQSIARQAADGSSSGKNRGVQVLSTQGIGKTSPGPRGAKAGSVRLAASPPQLAIQNAVPMTIYVTAGWGTGGWPGGGGNIYPQWDKRASTSGHAGGYNMRIGNAGPVPSSNLRLGGASSGPWGAAWNVHGGNLAAGKNGWSAAISGMSAQNLDPSLFGTQPAFDGGRMGGVPRRDKAMSEKACRHCIPSRPNTIPKSVHNTL